MRDSVVNGSVLVILRDFVCDNMDLLSNLTYFCAGESWLEIAFFPGIVVLVRLS